MPKSLFKNVKISGISTVVPSKELCLLDDKELYGGNEKKINRVVKSSGFLNRRVSERDVMTSDMCLQAASDLIDNLKVDKSEIDAILFLSYTPDYLMPATSYVLHKKLGLSQNCLCMDIPQACSGYVIGLFQASMLINSGYKRVLLLVGDSFSKFTDMFKDHTAPVFGDAGTATLVEYDENAETIYFNINSDGNGYDSLICENGGFKNIPNKDSFYDNGEFEYKAKMDGGRVFDFTMNNITPSLTDLLEFSNKNKDDFDYYVFHQANKFILQNIARQLEIDETKMPVETLSKYGNQCGASIPCTISDQLHDKINGKNVLMAGFGVGLSWASAIVKFDQNIYCSKVNEYIKGEYNE